MSQPLCKIAQENGGDVPLACLFGCARGCKTESTFGQDEPTMRPACRTCGEQCTWHHTGERWALMGDNGRLHTCNVTDDFDDITKD